MNSMVLSMACHSLGFVNMELKLGVTVILQDGHQQTGNGIVAVLRHGIFRDGTDWPEISTHSG
jgi:hypothetical protein